jgi:hypothetical protein
VGARQKGVKPGQSLGSENAIILFRMTIEEIKSQRFKCVLARKPTTGASRVTQCYTSTRHEGNDLAIDLSASVLSVSRNFGRISLCDCAASFLRLSLS